MVKQEQFIGPVGPIIKEYGPVRLRRLHAIPGRSEPVMQFPVLVMLVTDDEGHEHSSGTVRENASDLEGVLSELRRTLRMQEHDIAWFKEHRHSARHASEAAALLAQCTKLEAHHQLVEEAIRQLTSQR